MNYRAALFGHSYRAAKLGLGSAVALFLGVFALLGGWELARLGPFYLTGFQFKLALLVLMFGAAAGYAYANSGFVESLLLAVAPALGFFEARSILGLVGPVRPSVIEAVGQAVLYGVPVGVLGFVVGCVSHNIARKTKSWTESTSD